MPRYRVQDDEVVEATNPTDLVQKLTNTSFIAVASPAAFRVRAAFWIRELYGKEIRTFNDDVFVEDMLACGAYEIDTPNKDLN